MKYSVAQFEVVWDGNKELYVREYVVLAKNLSIEDAKTKKSENKGSWTYKESK